MTIWTVSAITGSAHRGVLAAGSECFLVSLGRSGIRPAKKEGDGATPSGRFRLERLLWREDRLARPRTGLPSSPIRPHHGWCDDPSSFRYNEPVHLPCAPSAECLWRQDHLYDLVVVISHNRHPAVPGNGSAVFIHLMREDERPTAGCIGLRTADLLKLLAHANPETMVEIQAG